ncbi:MAG: tetratricopeptide repeat protein [Gemmatimonadetes bacterium]|nr:tetratricopeptide repeat protein [Gemmatimonadota bacterium]
MTAPPPFAVAVLPFANLSGASEHEHFTDGLAESIRDALAGVRALRVAPWTSSLALKGRVTEAREAGERLQAAAVLDGGLRKTATRLQLTAQLATGPEGAARWSQRFDRPHADVFAVRHEVTRSVVAALGVTLTAEEERALARAPTTDIRAFDSYLRGRQLARQLLRRNQEYALQMFGDAIKVDPAFAAAHAGAAMCSAMMYQYWDSSDANVQAADAASAKAVELAPDLADARVARGVALSLAKRFDEAEQEFAAALELRPDSFEAYYFRARACRAQGQDALAAQWYERACELRPEDYATPQLLASVYLGLGRPDDAKATQRRALELAKQHLERYPDDARALYLGAGALAILGDSTRAREWAKRAVAMDPDDSAVLYNVACAYALMGLRDSAIDCLEQAIANGFRHWQWIEHDSDLDSLRESPRFGALLEKR